MVKGAAMRSRSIYPTGGFPYGEIDIFVISVSRLQPQISALSVLEPVLVGPKSPPIKPRFFDNLERPRHVVVTVCRFWPGSVGGNHATRDDRMRRVRECAEKQSGQ